MNLVSYIRVSTEKQESPDTQRDAIRRYCEYHGHTVVKEFSDVQSAKSADDRKDLQAALAMLGHGADGLVVYKLDRISRSVHDLSLMIRKYFQTYAIFSTTQQIETGTAHGRFVVNILAAMSEMDREQIAERTRDALRFRKASGVRYCKRLYGYRVGEDKRWEPVPQEQDHIQRMLRMRRNRSSLQEIADTLNSLEVTPPVPFMKKNGVSVPTKWHKQTVSDILTRELENAQVQGR